MDSMERRQPRDPEDISEPEIEEVGEIAEIPPDMRLLRTVLGSVVKPRIEVLSFVGGLNPEELVDWINEMNKCFDYEEMSEDKKVKFAVTKAEGTCCTLVGWSASRKEESWQAAYQTLGKNDG